MKRRVGRERLLCLRRDALLRRGVARAGARAVNKNSATLSDLPALGVPPSPDGKNHQLPLATAFLSSIFPIFSFAPLKLFSSLSPLLGTTNTHQSPYLGRPHPSANTSSTGSTNYTEVYHHSFTFFLPLSFLLYSLLSFLARSLSLFFCCSP